MEKLPPENIETNNIQSVQNKKESQKQLKKLPIGHL